MDDDNIETDHMVILTVCTQYFGESSSDESSEDSDDEALLLKTAVAMIERRAIPKIGSFIDIVFELRQPGIQNKFMAIKGYTIHLKIFKNS